MKRNKKIGILCGILICVSLAAFGVSRYEKQKEIIKNSDEIIMEVKSEKVNVLSWEYDTGSFAFHRDENGNWLYDEDEEFPVDEEKIKGLLELFEEFGVSFIIEGVKDFGQYGLDTPVCTIRMETETDTYEILLGNYSAMDSQRYVSVGDGNAYLVKIDPLERFEIELSDVIHHDKIPELKDVTQVQFSGMESEQIVYEEDSTNTYYSEDVYFLKKGETLLPLDTSKVQGYLDAIRNLNLKDYVNYKASEEDLAAYGLDTPELSVMIHHTRTEEDTEEEVKETFVLHIGRDPVEQEAEDTKSEITEDMEESDEDTEEEEVTAYVRIGESKIIYQLTTEQYKKLKEMTYDSLRHQELFWGDFSDMYQLDILLEDNSYTITSKLEDEKRTYYYQDEELELENIRNTIRGLRAERFTDQIPDQKEEISLTIYLDNENYPEIHIKLYRYDGNDCIAAVEGKTVAFVERNRVVDLMEAVNSIVLK
ncbi:DUF4340 domain-containing protein [Lachnospiraceae bacterium 62-35]